MESCAGKSKRNDDENVSENPKHEFRIATAPKREIYKRLPIREIEKNATMSRIHRPTASCDLPMEILDMILRKSYLHWILNSATMHRDEEVIGSLMSVDFCFNQTINRKRFKRSIWRYLNDFYGKAKKISAIIRNNRNYLVENIQPNDELIASLLSLNCITQEQSLFIQRQRSNQDKNDRLLYIAESFDEAKFSNLVECLRETNQKTVTRIMENGGGATKIVLQTRGAKFRASMESQLVILNKKIEEVKLDKIKTWSHKTYKFVSRLRDEGMEILNSRLVRRTVVVWIWCRSQAALESIQRLYESNQLRDAFVETFQTPPSTVVNIDENQFKKTIVVCAFSISLTQRIKWQYNARLGVCGVTKLRNKFFILFEWQPEPSSNPPPAPPPPVIHVFEDQNPFNWQKEINLTEIPVLDYIGSNEWENCLYVSHFWGRSVWKIKIEGDGGYKIIAWLRIDQKPTSLSVSNRSDGQFLALSDSSSLIIYGSDAKPIRSIQLPKDTKDHRHAVETSIGNFIILHRLAKKKRDIESELKWVISEFSRDGQTVIRRFIPSNEAQQLSIFVYLSIVDSEDRVFVRDCYNHRVILLDSDLKWNRIVLPSEEEEEKRWYFPGHLCYDEEKKQMIDVSILTICVYSTCQR